MAKYDNSNGVWRTIGGRRIFIKDGEDLATAMKKSGKFKKKESPVVNNAPDEIIDYLYDETGRDTVSVTEIKDFIDNDFLDDELADYQPTKEEYEAVYKELKKRGYKVYDEEATTKKNEDFTKKANEIHEKTKEKAIKTEKTTDLTKRDNTNAGGLSTKEDYEDQLRWYEDMEKKYPTKGGLKSNEEYQGIMKEYKSRFANDNYTAKDREAAETLKSQKNGLDKSLDALNEIDKIAGDDEKLQKLGRQMGSKSLSRWSNAYNEYKKKNPGTKLSLYEFIKMNEK